MLFDKYYHSRVTVSVTKKGNFKNLTIKYLISRWYKNEMINRIIQIIIKF